MDNPFEIAQQQLDEAAHRLKLDEAIHQLLRWPQREIQVSIPVRLDNGKTRVFRGYRVFYNGARGPGKGGLRWHPDETIDTVRALAAWMTWKTAAVGLPLGGAKGGITCNPKELSQGEKERLARGYIRAIGKYLGGTQDVPAPDVYTNPQIMAWMRDEYEAMNGHFDPGMITGKPLALGGSAGRGDATARGGVYAIREAARALDLPLRGSSCAVQGFGNAGQHVARLAQEKLGMKVVAVSDSRGGVYNRQGLDLETLIPHKMKTGTVQEFPGSEPLSQEDLLTLEVSVLIPAALEGVLHASNADKVRAQIVCELANGPTTPEADRILHERKIFVIPDILANAGGVTVSYFEQVQAASNFYWTDTEVDQRLDQTMTFSFQNVFQTAQREKIHPRLATYLISVRRVAEACQLRGWV